jgi:chorismate mutase
MTESQPHTASLADLRREIDEIDDALHDLIMRRSTIVEAIRAVKPTGGPAIRPARQAQILRRLLGRHQGQLSKTTISAIWRELIGAFTAVQGEFTIVVSAGLADLARREYGDAATIRTEAMPLQALKTSGASLAVLPWPSQQGWWRDLAAMTDRPAIVASVPFTGTPQAVAIGAVPFEASGDDCSLIVSAEAHIPFEQPELIAQSGEMRLFRVTGYVAADDARLDNRTLLLGGYPRPLA